MMELSSSTVDHRKVFEMAKVRGHYAK